MSTFLLKKWSSLPLVELLHMAHCQRSELSSSTALSTNFYLFPVANLSNPLTFVLSFLSLISLLINYCYTFVCSFENNFPAEDKQKQRQQEHEKEISLAETRRNTARHESNTHIKETSLRNQGLTPQDTTRHEVETRKTRRPR